MGLRRERRACTSTAEVSKLKGEVLRRLGSGKLGVEGVALGTGNRLSWGGVMGIGGRMNKGGVMDIGGRMNKGGVLGRVGIDRRTGAV